MMELFVSRLGIWKPLRSFLLNVWEFGARKGLFSQDDGNLGACKGFSTQ